MHVKIGGLNVICVYYPPSTATEIDIWLEEIIIKCNMNSGTELVVMGDFDARLTEWNDHQCNAKRQVFKRIY